MGRASLVKRFECKGFDFSAVDERTSRLSTTCWYAKQKVVALWMLGIFIGNPQKEL